VTNRVHLPLFFLSLLIAIGIKVAVPDDNQQRERNFDAKVTYVLSDELSVLGRVGEVKIRLRGKSDDMAVLSPFAVEMEVTLDADNLGIINYPLEPSGVRMPGDFEVISIEPNQLILEVERQIHRKLEIRADLLGEPAAGSKVAGSRVEPREAEVKGPKSRVEILDFLRTTPIHLDGHAISFQVSAPLLSPDPVVQIVEPSRVKVSVTMREPELSKTFEGMIQNSTPQL
jgi:YbbR domain-containing protein